MTLPELKSSSLDCFSYYGNREGWHVALSVNRDSDALERSNWDVITESVLAVPDDGDPEDELADAAIERMSHFLCGWVDYLLVRPGSSAERKALEWRERLEDYPVADEDHYSMLEWQEEWCVRCDRGTREDHTEEFSRTHRCNFRSADDVDTIQWRWRNR